MKIAFASCICTRVFADQPVWTQIAAQQPDALVLLEDSIYLDIATPGGQAPQDMTDDEFAQHLHALYCELLGQAQFRALVGGLSAGRVHAIWDDHDFLWNDACGAQVARRPDQRGKIALSTAFFAAYRTALAQGLSPGSFPAAYNNAVFWPPVTAPLPAPSLALDNDVWLHLSDGRTHRTQTWPLQESKRHLLGAAQRQQIGAAMAAAPNDLHLLASGSVLAAYKRYSADWRWLLNIAATHRTLVLSGDIHRNELDAFYTAGWPLHEATSSGAAVLDAVVAGTARQNFGLLDISPGEVRIDLFEQGIRRQQRRLSRATWLPL
jgi:alkaline phosphatase D